MNSCVNFSIVMATSQWCAFNHAPLPPVSLPLRGKTSRECEGEFLDFAQEEASYGTHTYTVQVRDSSSHEGVTSYINSVAPVYISCTPRVFVCVCVEL